MSNKEIGYPPIGIHMFRDQRLTKKVKLSQLKRYPVDADDEDTRLKQEAIQKEKLDIVNKVVEIDKLWREERFKYDNLKMEKNKMSKKIGEIMRNKDLTKDDKIEQRTQIITKAKEYEDKLNELTALHKKLELERNMYICQIGNICPENRGIVWSNNEDLSPIVREWSSGKMRNDDGLLNHIELVNKLGIVEDAVEISGSRSYFLKGLGCYLNQALINYGMEFLYNRGWEAKHCPFFMRKSQMSNCAQLKDYDEQLYKVTGEGEDKYLIATSEQPLCCYFKGKTFDKGELPAKVCGYSTCFRKESGNTSDAKGIFRVHQFEKIEQFCVTEPDKSWEMMDEMLSNSEEFYQSLGLPYRVINVVSGELNNAAAQKYDLEAWFPGSGKFRELVSCSNCLDYQSRRLQTKINDDFVHMLNCTLTATERTICCILENYQTEEGVKIPEPLVRFMPNGTDFILFK